MAHFDKMKEITDRLEQGIKDVYDSERYKLYLRTMSKFHSYSFRNSLLIMLQKPESTYVAGFNTWQALKRSVNRGEKGIQILAPAPYRVKVEMEKVDPATHKPVLNAFGKPVTELVEITKPAFRPAYVFDISQTSGQPLPQLTQELAGSISQYDKLFESIKSVSPFPIQFEDIPGITKGYCDHLNQKIAIKNGMSEKQNVKTAIHEITHADLHTNQLNLALSGRKDRRTREVEAESVAFVVCSHYGIDTSDYSFSYIASWSGNKELEELKASLATIQKQASELIDRIDARYHELIKEQESLKDNPGGNSDFYEMFYAGSGGQDTAAMAFQRETGWKRIWGSDSQGLNGDTWIVYRSISDLPKWLRMYAEGQEKSGQNVAVDGKNVGKPQTIAEKMKAAKERSLAQSHLIPNKSKRIERGER